MYFFGQKVKNSNVIRICIILGLVTVLLLLLEKYTSGNSNGRLFSSIFALSFAMILLGELTRKIFRKFFKEIVMADKSTDIEDKRDIESLNFTIAWLLIFISMILLSEKKCNSEMNV